MLPHHHPVNAPQSHLEEPAFNGSFKQFVWPSTLIQKLSQHRHPQFTGCLQVSTWTEGRQV